jgi:hypothetical protein
MNGSLAQLISLISYGNEYIVTGKLETGYYPQNNVFQFCKKVKFKTIKLSLFTKNKEIIAGDNPLEWFRYLKQNNCRELRAFYEHSQNQEKVKDYMLAGFVGGGGKWLIEVIYKDFSDFWYAHWNVGNQDDPDRKIWLVDYEAIVRKHEKRNIQLLLNPALDTLEKRLNEIELFAREHNLNSWADWFKNALVALQSENPNTNFYYPDLIVLKNYSLQAKQLIFSACKAWVFGGMGSWNDLGFGEKEEQEKYYKLTEELYEAVLVALLAGINTY